MSHFGDRRPQYSWGRRVTPRELGVERGFAALAGAAWEEADPAIKAAWQDAVGEQGVQPKEGKALLPPPRAPLRWSEVAKQLGRKAAEREEVPAPGVEQWWSTGQEADWPWAARTKTDLSIRRTRPRDLWMACRRGGGLAVRRLLRLLGTGFDHISALNLGTAAFLFGDRWVRRLEGLGAFAGDLTHYIDVTRKLTVLVKMRQLDDPDWRLYVELSGLAGYRNPPFPGFDLRKESEALAVGGEEHHWPEGYGFERIVEGALRCEADRVRWMSRDDYIRGTRWLTTGSSSVGHLEFTTPDGEHHRIKARKNFVLDTVPLEELVELARVQRGQVNTTLLKSELGKIRLAVAGDLATYLNMSWISYLMGGAYKQWRGSSLEETVPEQHVRLWRTWSAIRVAYGMPYDFAAFDHQPTTSELKSLARFFVRVAEQNVPLANLEAFRLEAGLIVDGFDASVLVTRMPDGSVTTRPVTGGLMSGLRWTSMMGNAWNTVVTSAVRIYLAQAGVDVTRTLGWVRGDDSLCVDERASVLRLFALGYDRVGAIGAIGKYSVLQHAGEFLRVWIDEDGCQGYPARALPGLTQRRPWSSQPWSEEMVVRALHEVVTTLRRRGVDDERLTQWWSSTTATWCSLHGLPVAAISTPSALGGFGIGQWDGRLRVRPTIPRVRRAGLEFTGTTKWRAAKWVDRAATLGLDLGAGDAERLASDELAGVVSNDDVPSVGRALRDEWKRELRQMHIRAVTAGTRRPRTVVEALPPVREASAVSDMVAALKDRPSTYGRFAHLLSAVQDASVILRQTGGSVSQWLKRHSRALWDATRGGHMAEMLDWELGRLSVQLEELHPSLSSIVLRLTTNALRFGRPRGGELHATMAYLARGYEAALLSTHWVRTCWMW